MNKMLVLATALLLAGSALQAALTEKDLAPAAIQKTIAATPAAKRQAVAKQVLEAISAQPMDAEAKVKALVSASRALLQGGGSVALIAEIFNTIPVEYLQSVAELLARENFNQEANGMTDEQYDTFCARVVASASEYIEVSGTDSPAVRISILAATFTSSSSNPERTRPQLIAALPTAMQAAAATFVLASEQGDREELAAAAGVDEVAAKTADPDADKIATPTVAAEDTAPAAAAAADAAEEADDAEVPVDEPEAPANPATETPPAMEPESDYLTPTPPPSTSDSAEADVPDVKVPLLSRFVDDVLGITIDAKMASLYSWDGNTLLPPSVDFEPVPELIPGEMAPAGQINPAPVPEYEPSPGYGNQEP